MDIKWEKDLYNENHQIKELIKAKISRNTEEATNLIADYCFEGSVRALDFLIGTDTELVELDAKSTEIIYECIFKAAKKDSIKYYLLLLKSCIIRKRSNYVRLIDCNYHYLMLESIKTKSLILPIAFCAIFGIGCQINHSKAFEVLKDEKEERLEWKILRNFIRNFGEKDVIGGSSDEKNRLIENEINASSDVYVLSSMHKTLNKIGETGNITGGKILNDFEYFLTRYLHPNEDKNVCFLHRLNMFDSEDMLFKTIVLLFYALNIKEDTRDEKD